MGNVRDVGAFGRGRGPVQWIGLLLCLALAAWLSYRVVTKESAVDTQTAIDPSAQTSSSTAPSGEPSPSTEPQPEAPNVPDQRRADFTKGDDLPDGSTLIDFGFNDSGMAVGDDGLTHGPALEGGGAGYLQTKLKSEVHSIGARVTFAKDSDAAVVLVAWRKQLVPPDEPGGLVPDTGLRVVVTPGSWKLTMVLAGSEEVLHEGTYNSLSGETVSFEVKYAGDFVYFVDPTERVTEVASPKTARLNSPWASWGLTELGPDQAPATIEAVWAG